jgi:hypothetical protein
MDDITALSLILRADYRRIIPQALNSMSIRARKRTETGLSFWIKRGGAIGMEELSHAIGMKGGACHLFLIGPLARALACQLGVKIRATIPRFLFEFFATWNGKTHEWALRPEFMQELARYDPGRFGRPKRTIRTICDLADRDADAEAEEWNKHRPAILKKLTGLLQQAAHQKGDSSAKAESRRLESTRYH